MIKNFFTLIDRYTSAAEHERGEISQALWQEFGAEHTVLVADMSHFTESVHRHGLLHYLCMIRAMQTVARPVIEAHRGRIVKFDADNVFAVFDAPLDALHGSLALNEALHARNAACSADAAIEVCIGIDHGQLLLVHDGTDLFGDCVNIACKLGEELAGPREILLTERAHAALPAMNGLSFQELSFKVSGFDVPTRKVIY
jgi:adenylate cyclase